MWMKGMIPVSLGVFMIINGVFEIILGVLVLFKISMKAAALFMALVFWKFEN